jgi:hypothetical protein
MPDRVVIEGNRCRIGAWQVGILVTDSAETTVCGNTVRLAPGGAVKPDDPTLPREAVAVAVTRTVSVANQAQLSADLAAFMAAFGPRSDELIRLHKTRRRALMAFARHVLAPGRPDDVDLGLWQAMGSVLTGWRAGGQGIVIGGSRAGIVRVVDNLVSGVVQGVHLATPALSSASAADDVLISRTVIRLLIPSGYYRERHGVLVGSARSLAVLDTSATVTRTGRKLVAVERPVEGIRVRGTLGPYLLIRQSSMSGFTVGVRVLPSSSPALNQRMWLVAETMAAGATKAVDAVLVPQANNFPVASLPARPRVP